MKQRALIVTAFGVGALACALVWVANARPHERWKRYKLASARVDVMERIRSGHLYPDDNCLKQLFNGGILAFPEVFRVWVESKHIEILFYWEGYLRNEYGNNMGVVPLPQLDEALALTPDKAVERGLKIRVSTEGTNFAGHGVAIFNPIIPYERTFGTGCWPSDLPLERIENPAGWNAAK
jgi:hypothetical protein